MRTHFHLVVSSSSFITLATTHLLHDKRRTARKAGERRRGSCAHTHTSTGKPISDSKINFAKNVWSVVGLIESGNEGSCAIEA